jgi:hypothetical protein
MPRSTQAQVALIAALLFLLVGFVLVAVLVAGVSGGAVSVTSPLLLGALAVGVFALAARLLHLARGPRTPPAGPQTPDYRPVLEYDIMQDRTPVINFPSDEAAVPRQRSQGAAERTRPRPSPNGRPASLKPGPDA